MARVLIINRWEELQAVQDRAATDPDYRARLLADPHTTLAPSGLDIPENVKIVIYEQARDEFLLLVPPYGGPGL